MTKCFVKVTFQLSEWGLS